MKNTKVNNKSFTFQKEDQAMSWYWSHNNFKIRKHFKKWLKGLQMEKL